MSDVSDPVFDEERGSEVEDYTGEVPRVDLHETSPDHGSASPSGFGDGDVADVDDPDDAISDAMTTDGVATPSVDAAEVDVGAVLAERDQLKEMLVRLQADFENFRKRTATQAEGDIDRATARLAEALLPVLDAAEAAYVRHPDEVGPLLNVMLAELKRHGLETLDLEGGAFDPEVAEAVAHEPGDGGEVRVAEVLRSGYRWRGKTLRAAMVRTQD